MWYLGNKLALLQLMLLQGLAAHANMLRLQPLRLLLLCLHLLAELLDVLAGLCLWKPEQLSVSAKVEVVRDTSF